VSPLARALLAELAADPEALRELAAEIAPYLPRTPAVDEGGWLDTRRAAEYAGCSVNALHRAMASRDVDFSQDCPGGKAYFRRSDIDAWRRGGAPSTLCKRD
jgi:hypothetical protein